MTARGVCIEVEEQFEWALWDGNPSSTPQWLEAHRLEGARLRAVRSFGRTTAVLERKLPGVYGPVGQHHGGFVPLPGATPSDVLAGLTSVVTHSWIALPHSPIRLHTELAKGLHRPAVAREHDRILFVEDADPAQYAKARPRKLRATIRKAEQMAEHYGLGVRWLQPGELSRVIEKLIHIERIGHRKRGFPLATYGVADALLRLDDDARLVVLILHGANQIGGYLVAGRGAKQDYFYTMAIRAELGDASAGTMMFAAAIRNALSRGRAANLGPGNTEFKRRFATGSEAQSDIVVMPRWAGISARPLTFALRRASNSEWN